jgi:hypothetical protein
MLLPLVLNSSCFPSYQELCRFLDSLCSDCFLVIMAHLFPLWISWKEMFWRLFSEFEEVRVDTDIRKRGNRHRFPVRAVLR